MFEFSSFEGSSGLETQAIAVVGSCRGLGKILVEYLADDPLTGTILGIDEGPAPRGVPSNYVHVQCPSGTSYTEHFVEHKVDVAIHAAFNGALGAEDPATVVPSTERFLEACRACTPGVVSYVSSAAVYGTDPDQDLFYEGALLKATTGLPAQRIAAESLVFEYVAHDPNVCLQIVRPCQIVGRDMDTLLTRMLERPVIFVPRETPLPLQLVHQNDAARAVLRLVRSRCVGVFNVAADGVVTVPQLAKLNERRVVRVPMFLFRRFLRGLGGEGLEEYFVDPWLVASVKVKTEALFMFRFDGAESYLESLEQDLFEERPTEIALAAAPPSDAETPTL